MRRVLFSAAIAVTGVVTGPLFVQTPLAAQGALSTQGFGYPLGQLSTRALGTGGALGEIDPRSPLNPAALTLGPGQIFAQYDPELRNVRGPSGRSRTTTARFPNFGANLPLGQKWILGFSASTLLDRSWSTQAVRDQSVGDETVTLTETLKSEGGITDLRFAIGYAFTSKFRVGIAGHQYTGTNRINLLQQFPDSLAYGNVSQTTSLNYEGNAFSAGVVLDVLPSIRVALSGRRGGNIELSANDTMLTEGKIPDHYAASVSFDGIPGTIIAARYAQDKWSSLTSLSTAGATAIDATEMNAGIETTAMRAGDRSIILRVGGRWRKLPFLANSQEVRETSYGGGLGIPFARNRASIDFAVLRNTRSGVSNIKESAYNFSFGLRIQP
jgi:hypothetical protein